MKDISYHLLDIVENSLHAGAANISVDIREDLKTGKYVLKIQDDGCGMTQDMLRQVTDPFFTTSAKKHVGLGIPLLKQNVEMTGGTFSIDSFSGKGTCITASFNCNHIDMIPEGDIAMTVRTLIAGNPDFNFIFHVQKDDTEFTLDTAEIRRNLEGISLCTHEVLEYITDFVRENMKALSVCEKK